MKKEHVIKLAALPLLLLCAMSCADKTDSGKTEQVPAAPANLVELNPEQVKAIQLRLGKIEMKDLSGAVKANGMLDVPPQNLVSVSAPMGGFVKSTELLQGMKVQKGQAIVVMQHPDYIQLQQDFLEVKSQLDYLKAEYQRQQELAKENVNAAKVLQLARSQYEANLAKYAGLHARLQLLDIDADKLNEKNIQSTITIHSPIRGFVTHVNVNIGMYVNPTDIMFKIVDTEHLHAELTVFEKDIPKIKVGQKVRLMLANEHHERTATVYLVGREISPDRTVRIHCHLDKEDSNLLPGTYLSAYVEAGARHVPALPDQAIVNFDGKYYVFVAGARERQFRMIPVTKGLSELGYTEVNVTSDLTPASEVVTEGAYDLLAKLKNSEEQ
jgi:cobalt-zinc-cadmium efflux system membrane fusion protein